MRKILFGLLMGAIIAPNFIFAQQNPIKTAGSPYWQQQVNYLIRVKLDDEKHQLHGNIAFTYINNSPTTISEIPVHLWANGYANSKTALAKQLQKLGKEKLTGKNPEEFGGIDSLDFVALNNSGESISADKKKLIWRYDATHIDIAYVTLQTPLKTGDSVIIATNFRIRIPDASVSRMGHVGQAYQITQWYPKPAVFDKLGWHAMPYLNQGEFYSEFGNFNVFITLPDNYTVGATGDLQTESEITRMDYLASTTKVKPSYLKFKQDSTKTYNLPSETPASSKTWKTLHYTQSKVHDFAWFADKTFIVNKGSVTLWKSKRKVTTWTLFTPNNANLWQFAQEYIQDATYYYSLWNGDYPYNQVTAVDGTISAGGGMEYPNVTVIGNASRRQELEVVIVHEVGHNWFYGILGSNERDNGWMDEGLNTLNEMRYMETKYPNNNYLKDGFGLPKKFNFHLESFSHSDEGNYSVRMIQNLAIDQPICTHSADFTSMNYGIIMYQKTGLIFNMLRENLGDSLFDICFRQYYKQWSFKHPQPQDLQQIFEQYSHRDLNYIFNDLIQTTKHIDYTITKAKPAIQDNQVGYLVKVRNVGQVTLPVPVSIIDYNNQVVETQWTVIDPNKKLTRTQTLFIPSPLKRNEIHKFQIDANNRIPESQQHNNVYYPNRLEPYLPEFNIEFLSGNHEPGMENVFYSPVVGWNAADKLMVGAIFHNYALPIRRSSFVMMPMYALGSKTLRGILDLTYTYYPRKLATKANLGIYGFIFGNNNSIVNIHQEVSDIVLNNNKNNYYSTINPYLRITLGNADKKTNFNFSHELLLKGTAQLMKRTVINDPLIGIEFNNLPTILRNRTMTVGAQAQYNLRKISKKWNYSASINQEVLSQSIHFADSVMFNFNNYFPQSLFKNTTVFRNSIQAQISWKYYKTRTVSVRVYGGTIWGDKYKTRDGSRINGLERLGLSMTGAPGERDYFAENLYLNRSANTSLSQTYSQQRGNNQGGIHSVTELGLSCREVFTINSYLTLPFGPKFLGLFYDLGMAQGLNFNRYWMHTAGIGIKFGEYVGIYIPVLNSSNISNGFVNTSWNNQIRININLNLHQLLPF